MDKQIRKLKELIRLHLNQSKTELVDRYGNPGKKSDNEIWFYRKYHSGIYKDEIAFIFEEDHIVDITVTEHIFCIEYKNIFYYEGQDPEYKVIKLL